jgi:hypothetical protein
MVSLQPGVDLAVGDILQDAQDGILTLTDAIAALSNTAFTEGAQLTKFVSGQVIAQLGVFDKIFAKEIHTEKLCVGDVCVTEQQFLQMVQGQVAGTTTPPQNPPPQDPPPADPPAPTDLPPTIVIQGNSPATINVGDTYADLGALVTDDIDTNLALVTLLDGVETALVTIDTSVAGEHTVTYRATDSGNHTTEVTRTVIVQAPAPQDPPPADPPPPTP